MVFDLVAMGTSLGGLSALRNVLVRLPEDFPAAIAVVQHRHKESDTALSEFLQQFTSLRVGEVEDKTQILPGHVYLAPADYHLLVEPGCFSLSTDEPVSYARPSIDVLLESAADAYGERLIALLLTSANQDGVRGLATVKARGGLALVQSPQSAMSPVLPQAAIAAVAVDQILPLTEIGPYLAQLCRPIGA